MFSFIRPIVFGSLKFEVRRSHCISMIFSSLNEDVSPTSTSASEILVKPLPGGDPRENLVHDVVQSYFAFDVREGGIAEGLNFELKFMR
jgi:hypothetical protein